MVDILLSVSFGRCEPGYGAEDADNYGSDDNAPAEEELVWPGEVGVSRRNIIVVQSIPVRHNNSLVIDEKRSLCFNFAQSLSDADTWARRCPYSLCPPLGIS